MDTEQSKREYEISYWLTDIAAEPGISALLAKHSAEVKFSKPALEMRLAYPIKKQARGFFGFTRLLLHPAAIKPIHEELSRMPAILRFMIVVPDAEPEREPSGPPPAMREGAPAPSEKPAVPVSEPSGPSNADLEAKLKELG